MEILGNYDTKTNQSVLTPKQLNLVSSKFQESFQGFSSNNDECFEGDLRVFQGNFKGISRAFQRR